MKRRDFIQTGMAASAVLSTPAAPAKATELERETAIQRTALDYIEGWYTGDAERMERALHPELAKRTLLKGPDGQRRLHHIGAMTLVQQTRAHGSREDRNSRREVRVLDIFQGTASVRVDASDWIDYMHLVEVDGGRWQIVNVLWDLRL